MKKLDREYNNLIHNLCKLRKQHNLPKYKMAKILGISVSSWNKIENGCLPGGLSINFIFNAWDYFGICPKDLLATKL